MSHLVHFEIRGSSFASTGVAASASTEYDLRGRQDRPDYVAQEGRTPMGDFPPAARWPRPS